MNTDRWILFGLCILVAFLAGWLTRHDLQAHRIAELEERNARIVALANDTAVKSAQIVSQTGSEELAEAFRGIGYASLLPKKQVQQPINIPPEMLSGLIQSMVPKQQKGEQAQ